jgi:hypothetical protein
MTGLLDSRLWPAARPESAMLPPRATHALRAVGHQLNRREG